jgi:hypothetical protein
MQKKVKEKDKKLLVMELNLKKLLIKQDISKQNIRMLKIFQTLKCQPTLTGEMSMDSTLPMSTVTRVTVVPATL